ncbi:MAG: hypothetical protein EBS01_12415, partial [Verrucomicrobia bacterium]|nr:hypothetical protein [Verrucomicrobiota bacterium]
SETIGSVTISYGTGASADAAIGIYTGSVTPSEATGGTFTPSNYSISYVSGKITVSGFTPGNLIVTRYGDGTATLGSTATTLNILEINPVNGGTNQTLSTIASGAFLLTDAGNSTSQGYLNTFGTNTALPGYNSALNTASITAQNTKAVNILGRAATVITRVTFPTGGPSATPPSPFSGANFRSVIATDTNKFYASGNSSGSPVTAGMWYYNGSFFTQICTNPISNLRNVEIYNGNLYFSTGSGTIGIHQVGTGLPTTSGQIATVVIPTGAGTSPYGFAISPDGNTAYVADDSTVNANSGGGIQKWTKSGSTWTRQYTFGTQARGLAVDFSGENPVIYATTGATTDTSNNRIIKIVDTGASATSTDVAVAGANYVFRGLDFAPAEIPVITPDGTLASISTTYGTPSASTQFTVSGVFMREGILVKAPTGLEVSTDNSNFSSAVTVGSSGTVSSTPIYVRLAANANAGNYSGSISLSSSGAIRVSVATVSSTVSKANSTIEVTGATSFTYNGSGQGPDTSSVSGSSGSVTYSYEGTGATSYSASATKPTNAGTYSVTATVAADSNHEEATSSAYAFTIAKATPTVATAPTATLSYGQTLSSAVFSGGSVTGVGGASLAGSYAFDNGSIAPNNTGPFGPYDATFTPTDTANYNTTSTPVALTVGPASVDGTTVTLNFNSGIPLDLVTTLPGWDSNDTQGANI